jgi:glycine N-methyltransferase
MDDNDADAKAARLWNNSTQTRSPVYRNWIVDLLKGSGCKTIYDAACGTGVDSVMFIEEGFHVVSTDFSSQMLTYAQKERWDRRKDPAFDQWIIEEANWMTLADDLRGTPGLPDGGFDAVLCIGNSIPYLPVPGGDQSGLRLALTNLMMFVKPGGLLVIDHRNYDEIVATGKIPSSIYYKYKYSVDLTPNIMRAADGKPEAVVIDYRLDLDKLTSEDKKVLKIASSMKNFHFRLKLFPHSLSDFTRLLNDVYGHQNVVHKVFGDFKPLSELSTPPAYYIHVLQKPIVDV